MRNLIGYLKKTLLATSLFFFLFLIPLSKISAQESTFNVSATFVHNVNGMNVNTDLTIYIATDTTNFLLTSYPDIYLYSALVAAAPYIHDDGRISTWATLLNTAIGEVNRLDGRNRSKSNLVIDAGLRQFYNANILLGE